jgi:hypothetical protein
MRLPRLTIRRLMIAIALVGALLTLVLNFPDWADGRRTRFGRTGFEHAGKYVALSRMPSGANARLLKYHDYMRRKYHLAYRYPWIPVLPDPPEPEANP